MKWLNLILILIVSVLLFGCGDKAAKQAITKQAGNVYVPAKESIYPSEDKILILDSAFSDSSMNWTPAEIEKILTNRYTLRGMFEYIDAKKTFDNQMTFGDAKAYMKQGKYHYVSFRAVLDTRIDKLSLRDKVIYGDTIKDIDRVLKQVESYLDASEKELNELAEDFDFAVIGEAFDAIKPLILSVM